MWDGLKSYKMFEIVFKITVKCKSSLFYLREYGESLCGGPLVWEMSFDEHLQGDAYLTVFTKNRKKLLEN